jgi:hypothetical protein
MATFFGIIGIVLAILRGARRDLLLLIWVVCMFIFSIAYIFGVNVISFRVLLYILIPLSILGGSSIKFIFDKLSEQKVILPKVLPALFLLFIIGLSTFYGITIAMNPKTVAFGAKTVYGNVSTAPPSDYDMELAQWFEKNGDKTKMAASGNFYTAMFLIATTNQPISRSHEVLTGAKTKSFLISNDIKYLIYDKRLYFSSSDNVPFITADSGQLLYYNKKMKQKPDIPNFAKIVYENKYYIVCQVF